MISLPQLFARHLKAPLTYPAGLPQELLDQAQTLGMTVHQGKVKDGISCDGELWLYHSDRLSAYDTPIGLSPERGEIICELSSQWFHALTHAFPHIPHHFIHQPSPRIMVLKQIKPIRVEVIVRGAFCGSMAKDVSQGKLSPYKHHYTHHQLSQFNLYDQLPSPCVHLTTKAQLGDHDISGSVQSFIHQKLLTSAQWHLIEQTALAIFNWAAKIYQRHHWLLADTKFEFGIHPQDPQRIMLIDEILTPDTSRLWSLDDHPHSSGPKLKFHNHHPISWDKDILRNYLKSLSSMDAMTPEQLAQITTQLIHSYKQVATTLAEWFSSPSNIA